MINMNNLQQSGPDTSTLENFKILRTIWKNSFDKILEIKVIF